MPSYVQTVSPALKPVDIDEVKDYLQIEDNSDDTTIAALIDAAVQYTQDYQWSQLITATWVMRLDCFPSVIVTHPTPLIAVTTLEYVDTSGTTQTLVANTDYVVDAYRKPGLIYPAFNKSWPATRGFANDVTVTFTAGYGSLPSSVPRDIREAMLLMIYQWFNGGGCESADIPMLAKSLLSLKTFRTMW